jgi:hypothetical protein
MGKLAIGLMVAIEPFFASAASVCEKCRRKLIGQSTNEFTIAN